MKIEAVCVSHKGRVCSNNEDNFYFHGEWMTATEEGTEGILTLRKKTNKPVCLAVFDGMGGESNGEEASHIAAETSATRMRDIETDLEKDEVEEFLKGHCLQANQRICEVAQEKGLSRMGSTAAMLYVWEKDIWMCNIGDSRVYQFTNGKLKQWSVDHTDAAYLQAQNIQGRKPRLTQHLGILPDEMLIEPFVDHKQVEHNDIYLLCSDGLTDMVTEEEIEEILRENADLTAYVQQLLDMALDRGGRDNITIIICKTVKKSFLWW